MGWKTIAINHEKKLYFFSFTAIRFWSYLYSAFVGIYKNNEGISFTVTHGRTVTVRNLLLQLGLEHKSRLRRKIPIFLTDTRIYSTKTCIFLRKNRNTHTHTHTICLPISSDTSRINGFLSQNLVHIVAGVWRVRNGSLGRCQRSEASFGSKERKNEEFETLLFNNLIPIFFYYENGTVSHYSASHVLWGCIIKYNDLFSKDLDSHLDTNVLAHHCALKVQCVSRRNIGSTVNRGNGRSTEVFGDVFGQRPNGRISGRKDVLTLASYKGAFRLR